MKKKPDSVAEGRPFTSVQASVNIEGLMLGKDFLHVTSEEHHWSGESPNTALGHSYQRETRLAPSL